MDAAAAKPSPTFSHLGPLALWLAIQVLALTAPVAQFRLSEQFIRPAERAALAEMLILQIASAATLWPLLLRTPAAVPLLAAATWPFIQLSGILSAVGPYRLVATGVYVTGWLTLLGLWAFILQTPRQKMIGSAVTAILALGGPILWYLQAEFVQNRAAVDWNADRLLGPAMAALAIAYEEPQSCRPWLALGIALLLSALLAASLWKTRQRARRMPEPPPAKA